LDFRVWDLRAETETKSCPVDDPITSLELTLNGKYLISTSGKKITFWDLRFLFILLYFFFCFFFSCFIWN